MNNKFPSTIRLVIMIQSDADTSVSTADIVCEVDGVGVFIQSPVTVESFDQDLSHAIRDAFNDARPIDSTGIPIFDESKEKAKKKDTSTKSATPPAPKMPHAKLAKKEGWEIDTEEWLIPTKYIEQFREWKQAHESQEKGQKAS